MGRGPSTSVTARRCALAACGSSRRSYLQQQLVPFASSNPQIKFTVGRWPNRHPFVIGRYLADGEKVLSLKNLSPLQVASRVQFLRDSRPVPLRKWQKQLRSSPSIQGSWQMGRELPAHKVIRAPSALRSSSICNLVLGL